MLGGVQTVFNQGNDFDWFDSPFLRAAMAAIALALPCLIVWELDEPHAAFDVRLFAQRNFAVGVTCLTLGFLVVQGLLSLLIVQLQLLLGYSSSLAGVLFLAMILPAAPVTAVMHEVVKGVDARVFACFNLLGFAFVFFWMGRSTTRNPSTKSFGPCCCSAFSSARFLHPSPHWPCTACHPARSCAQRKKPACCVSPPARSASPCRASCCSAAARSTNCTWPTNWAAGASPPWTSGDKRHRGWSRPDWTAPWRKASWRAPSSSTPPSWR
ncbi:hypothetical protein [Methylogaea oryzae]|uniref:hypothetical protein n=1 Tax=Methylogaea oryzae TaxID=1295382 RepID=UPI0020D0A5C1|nr:hypothetical protein [Methylogaea oryzae]